MTWFVLCVTACVVGVYLSIRLNADKRIQEGRRKVVLLQRTVALEHEVFPDKSVEWFNHDRCGECEELRMDIAQKMGRIVISKDPLSYDDLQRLKRAFIRNQSRPIILSGDVKVTPAPRDHQYCEFCNIWGHQAKHCDALKYMDDYDG